MPIVTTRSASPSAATALATPPVTITTEQPQSNGHSSKANALLDSVIDAIQSPTKTANPIMIPPQPPATTPGSTRTRTASEVSSPTRRNRTLADLVFGPEDRVEEPLPTIQLPLSLLLASHARYPRNGLLTTTCLLLTSLRHLHLPRCRLEGWLWARLALRICRTMIRAS